MKSKACTRCRQWKVKCDADECSETGCSRCRSLKVNCIFDPSFKRVSTAKRWEQMQSEIARLKQAQQIQPSQTVEQVEEASQTVPDISPPPATSKSSGGSDYRRVADQGCTSPLVALISQPSQLSAFQAVPTQKTSSFSQPLSDPFAQTQTGKVTQSSSSPEFGSRYQRSLGDINLTTGQISEIFKRYRTSHHPFLPFTLLESSEVLFNKSRLLFWVICAVASSHRLKPRFAPHIKALVAEVLTSSARSVQTVQALLIICMWPFSFPSLAEDASFFYSGLATQLGLQLGLHRPNITHTHLGGSEQQDIETDFESRLTTWLACFVVNEVQASYRGVPPSVLVDFSFLDSMNHPKVHPTLRRLCHISRLNVQASLTIGAKASNPSGLLDPSSRTGMVVLFGAQFASLLQEYLLPMDDITERAFLSARIQLWSFALLDDMPFNPDLLEIYHQAEADAVRLIQLGCERNLMSAPFHVSRSITYSAVILIKILKSPYATQHEAIVDHIDRARQALSSAVTAENDVTRKAWELLQDLPSLEDRKLTPQIFSRMTASIIYDALRVNAENKFHLLSLMQPPNAIDLDGFDWDSFQL